MHNSNFEPDAFNRTYDRKHYYHSRNGKMVYNQMREKILEGRGILCLTGESGIGKSFLLQEMAADLSSEVTFIRIPSNQQTFQGVISELCEDLGLATGKEIILVALQSIYKFLEEQQNINPRIVIVIDDAHHLKDGVLDKLFLLSIPPSYKSSSLQIVFSGLPGFEIKGSQDKRPSTEQSKFICYKLERLAPSEILDFIKHFFNTGDYHNADLFTSPAISSIVDFSSGIPRLIKKIIDSALFAIGGPESPKVTEKLISYVAKDLLLVPIDTVNETVAVRPHQSNYTEVKNAEFLATEEMLSLAGSNICDNIDKIANQQLVKRSSLYEAETELTNQSDLALGGTTEKPYVENEEIRLEPMMNTTVKQRLTWGLAALVILGMAVFTYQSIISSPNDTPSIATLEEKLSLNEPRPVNPKDTIIGMRRQKKSSFKPKLKHNSDQNLKASTAKPGSAARIFIAELENGSQSTNLDRVYDRAEVLSKQNQPVDAYLLNFYAAKRGHGKAAFRLAQMADPATFSKKFKLLMFDTANVTQANKWYLQAMLAGHPEAKQFLEQLRARVRTKAAAGDEIAQRLMMQFKNRKILIS